MIILILILLQGCLSQSIYNLQDAERNKIINLLNGARSNQDSSNMYKVSWDYSLENILYTFLNTIANKEWFYDDWPIQNNVIIYTKTNLNGYNIFNINSPVLNALRDYEYLWHDTCNNKVDAMYSIYRYRVRQDICFDYAFLKNNNATAHNNFYISGSKYPSLNYPVKGAKPGFHCYNWWQYFPIFVKSNIKTVACVFLDIPGKWTPNHQKNTFWCYGKTGPENPDIRYPYTKGPACSLCSACEDKLCV